MQELDTVLGDRRFAHVILVDDARLFTGEHGYPKLSELEAFVHERRSDVRVDVVWDFIRIVSPQ
jgi:hypothetical protein